MMQLKIPLACSLCGLDRDVRRSQICAVKNGRANNVCRTCAIRLVHCKPHNPNRLITWGSKIREAQHRPEYRARRATAFKCLGCGQEKSSGYVGHQRYCGKKCQYAARANDPLKKKAFVFGANLRMGKGKQAFLEELLKAALLKPCTYCNVLIILENCSLDHKTPYADSKIRRYGSATLKRHFDQPNNLQIICRECNQLKGELDDIQFRTLLDFLLHHPSIGTYVRNRIARGNLIWKFRAKLGEPRIA